MRFFGKPTAREKEIRRSKAERRPIWYQRVFERVHPASLALLVLSAAATALIVDLGGDVLGLREGQRVSRAITSRVAFSIADEARTQVMRMRARDNAPDCYKLDASLLQDIRGRLASALRIAREQAADPQKLREAAAAIKLQLDDAGLEELARIAALPDATSYEWAVDRALEALHRQPLVEASEEVPRRTGIEAVLMDPNQPAPRRVPISQLLFANTRDSVEKIADAGAASFPAPLRPSIKTSLMAMLQGDTPDTFKPLYRYDAEASAKAAQEAENSVQVQEVRYAVGSRLTEGSDVAREKWGELTRPELGVLQKEHDHYLAARDSNPESLRAYRWTLAARGAMIFVVVCGLGGYILLRHERPRESRRSHFATAGALLLMLLLARLAYLHAPDVYPAVGSQAFVVALLAITSRRVAGQAAGALLALLITLATRQGIGFLVVLAVVSGVLFIGLRDVRNRGRIIAVGALASLAVAVATVLVGVVDGQTLRFVLWNRALWAALATVAAAFIVEGLLPGIERLFGVTTNMTLLEWCDPGKTLLRMMAAESPGTYNHSLLVGALADAAAEAISANGLLARAGAYYHDIGKINKPEYFVENQGLGMVNRHERLSPAMSHLIIIGHVKDGIEMAKAYGVPTPLRAFIPEHHGTCVIEYFYHAATKARRPGDPEVSDLQFRYPGPKPQSRETAIVMLCDGVEGAVRAMPEPTPQRIEDTVVGMIRKRLMDGQFDECDLTFRELAMIRQSLVKSLISIYHARITYPSDEKDMAPEVQSAS